MNLNLFSEMPKQIENIEDEEVFTITELASMVGFTPKSVKNWVNNGLLCAYKFGVRSKDEENDESNAGLRIFGADLKAFFKQSQVVPKRFRKLHNRVIKIKN